MPTIINMPKLSDTMTEGTLLSWKVKKGDKVELGQIIAEVETDKATMEMESFGDGVVHELYAAEGDKIPVGGKMAQIIGEGEDADAAPSEAPAETTEAKPTSKPEANAPQAKPANAAPASGAPSTPVAAVAPSTAKVSGARVLASPLAKKIAAEKGLDLSTLAGTGPGGRIVVADVENARPVSAPTSSTSQATAGSTPTILPKVGEGDQVVPISSMRKIIAERLLASKLQLPHFYLRLEVNAAALMTLREQVNASEAQREGGNKYSVNDFILKAVVSAMQAVPAVNASWNGDSIVKFASIGLSVAISVDDGLVTPVIKKAESKSLLEISRAVKDLAVRARDKKLKPDEFDGGTITVSNLGAWGIDHFDAIINPPQASIISVGAIKQQPVVENGQIVVGQRMWLGLSCDHRVIDGAIGASFLAEVAKRIEQPALMLV